MGSKNDISKPNPELAFIDSIYKIEREIDPAFMIYYYQPELLEILMGYGLFRTILHLVKLSWILSWTRRDSE